MELTRPERDRDVLDKRGEDLHSKEKHQKLAGVVKGVHAKLRKQFHQSGNIDEVWKEHCQDEALLTEYAGAMHTLATEIWTKKPETRIDWCRKTCLEYFFHGGLQKALDKQSRREKFAQVRKVKLMENLAMSGTHHHLSKSQERLNAESQGSSSYSDKVNQMDEAASQDYASQGIGAKSPNQVPVDVMNGVKNDRSGVERAVVRQQCAMDRDLVYDNPNRPEAGTTSDDVITRKSIHQYNTISQPFHGKIHLLDVGSCFNAFKEYDEFQALGVDISPAVESVYHCDFLSLETREPLQLASDSVGTFLKNLRSPIEVLPSESFHVVVFSLLLEYFPSTYQRWICCQKAQKLLMINGILIIITPDSHHQNKNAPMMKSWKKAIESLGFSRWRYVKLEHLHCMVFRKVAPVSLSSDTSNLLVKDTGPDMLYIPQDSHCTQDEAEDTSTYMFGSVLPCEEDGSFASNMQELPGYIDI